MTYSLDLRERVVEYVRSGGSKADAARRFSVHRDTVYEWLKREDLAPKAPALRQRKIDKKALRDHVKAHPDMLLRERAPLFGVSISGLSYALKVMKIGKKKSANIVSETL